MTRYAASIIAALACGRHALGPAGWPRPAAGRGAGCRPDDTIVDIRGDAANGFEIHHYDGSSLFPPTDSEALAECNEYATRLARVRCRVEVRTWYRDLGDPAGVRWATSRRSARGATSRGMRSGRIGGMEAGPFDRVWSRGRTGP